MRPFEEVSQPFVGTIEADGRRFTVTCRIVYDGIEYVGRLWFADEAWDDIGLPDRGPFPGRTKEEVLALAKRLTEDELVARFRRAVVEKRRFKSLRRAVDDILAKVRYLNQVAISMRAGLLDVQGAAQEIDLTERQLHEAIDRLRDVVGIED
jgi:hypothetical protein